LDTTSRKVFIPDGGPVVLSDTVGFIKHLPHALVDAFGATLEETVQADLLLHVIDVSSTSRDAQIEQVDRVLTEIGADQVLQLLVLNKIDLAGMEPGLERDEYGRIRKVWVSAQSGAGMELVRQALAEHQHRLMDAIQQVNAVA
jgi:GTP-binding protein HflX